MSEILAKTIVGNISADSNTITFTDSLINDNSILETYYDDSSVYTVDLMQTGNSVVITCSEHTNAINCKLLINNITTLSEYDDSSLVSQTEQLSSDVININSQISDLDSRVSEHQQNFNGVFRALDSLDENKQDTLIEGDNITIVDNVISANSGGWAITPNSSLILRGGGDASSDYTYTVEHDGVYYMSMAYTKTDRSYAFKINDSIIQGYGGLTTGPWSMCGPFYCKTGTRLSVSGSYTAIVEITNIE